MPSSLAGSRRQLVTIAGGLILIAIVMALPVPTPPPAAGGAEVQALHGRILEIVPPSPDGTDQGRPPVPMARIVVLDGDRAGEVLEASLEGPGGTEVASGFMPGDEVVVSITRADAAAEPYVAVADRWRTPVLGFLALLFAVAVLVVGGWRGARALIALGLTIAVLLRILVPLLIAGVAPIPLAVFGATAITAMTILLTEGWSRASLAAILGTAGALAVTGLLAGAATAVAGFTYVAGADLNFLATIDGAQLDLRGILLAAIIIGAVGVLDDVTVTQAVVVEELARQGSRRGPALFASALRIGRSHIGATVNTLFLAYVGAGLPLLVVLLVSRQPTDLVLNNEEIATEIVRTLVGSLGILAAVPLTTFIAVSLVGSAASGQTGPGIEPPARSWASAGPVLVVALIIGLLLAATVALPSRGPVVVRDGSPAGVSPAPWMTAGPGAPAGTASTNVPEPMVVARGVPVEVTASGEVVGRITVTRWSIPVRPADGSARRVTVEARYDAMAAWSPDAAAWELRPAEGDAVPLWSVEPVRLPLAPGAAVTVTFQADTSADLAGAVIAYVDRLTGSVLLILPIE